jgi:hypothetical protein
VSIAVAATPGSLSAPPHEAPAPGVPPLSTGRLLFRFAIGLCQLGEQGLATMLRASDVEAPPAAPSMMSQALVGAAVAAPGSLRALGARVGLRRAQARARRLAGHGVGLLRRAPGGRRLFARVDRWGMQVAGRLVQLAAVGQQEQVEGRALARGVVGRLFRAGVAELAGSAEIKRVIHEQSEGIAGEAILDIRAQSIRADNAVEALALRLFGRRPRGSK